MTKCSMYITRRKKNRTAFLYITLILLLIIVPFWLVILITCTSLMYKSAFWFIKKIRYEKIQKTIEGLFFVIFMFTIGIVFKTLVFDIYRVSSNSMQDTLHSDDIIIVNKLLYGPALPRGVFEISWVKPFFFSGNKSERDTNRKEASYRRLSGTCSLENGDVLVYQQAPGFFIVKRCVAIAGDTLKIDGGEIYVNRKHHLSSNTIKENYQLFVSNRKVFYKVMDSLGITTPFYNEQNQYNLLRGSLSKEKLNTLKNLKIFNDTKKVFDSYSIDKDLFAMPEGTYWTLDNMGPFIVPKKGMKIEINDWSFEVYGKTILDFEGEVIEKKEGGYYDSTGNKIAKYTFSQDFCFLMGDNRKASVDSRYFGFVPKSNIVGKVQCVLYSNK